MQIWRGVYQGIWALGLCFPKILVHLVPLQPTHLCKIKIFHIDMYLVCGIVTRRIIDYTVQSAGHYCIINPLLQTPITSGSSFRGLFCNNKWMTDCITHISTLLHCFGISFNIQIYITKCIYHYIWEVSVAHLSPLWTKPSFFSANKETGNSIWC